MSASVLISAAEVFCPVGLDAVQAATSVSTGISRVEASSLMDDRFEPITMGLIPEDVMAPIAETIQAQPYMTAHTARLLRLLSPCLENLVSSGVTPAEMPMFLAGPGPADRPHGSFFDSFFANIEVQSGIPFLQSQSRLFPNGRAGFFEAMSEATRYIDAAKSDHVLVGGVDSFADPMDLSRYLSEERIMRDGVMDGFTPGEGAALMVVSHPRAPSPLGAAPLAQMMGVGLDQEEGHRYSDAPYRGDGLSRTFSKMFDTIRTDPGPVNTVFAGFTGENFNAKEWGVAFLRNKQHFNDDHAVEHPAEYFGDARAALPAIMTAVGAFGLSRRMWEGPMLVWASSDNAPRGSLLMTEVSP